MYHFQYVSKKDTKQVKGEFLDIIHKVQNKVRRHFTFNYYFIGSEKLNMVVCDTRSNIGFDFDINIEVNDEDQNYSAKDIKKYL